MKKVMTLLAVVLVLGAGSFAQTGQSKKMDSTHKTMKKPMKKMKKRMDSASSDSSSATPMQ